MQQSYIFLNEKYNNDIVRSDRNELWRRRIQYYGNVFPQNQTDGARDWD